MFLLIGQMPFLGFFSLAKNCLCLIFLLFSQYFSVLENDQQSLVTSICVTNLLVITLCQMPCFFLIIVASFVSNCQMLFSFLLLHRLFQMSVGRSPILFGDDGRPGLSQTSSNTCLVSEWKVARNRAQSELLRAWSDRSFNCQSETSTQRPLPTSTVATSATSVQQDLRSLLCRAAVVRCNVTFFIFDVIFGFFSEVVWFLSASAESSCSELRGTEGSASPPEPRVVDSAWGASSPITSVFASGSEPSSVSSIVGSMVSSVWRTVTLVSSCHRLDSASSCPGLSTVGRS